MPVIEHIETPVRVSGRISKFDILAPLEAQTNVVDSMFPPHAAEYISAQNALSRECAALQLIDKDIEECQQRIARAYEQIRLLEDQRDAVRYRVSIYRAQLSPLRTIPDQVLQEIFQHCLPNVPYVVPSTRATPLILTHVCRRWRAVAQATSELWSSIALNDRGVWNYELEIEMVKRWLYRCHMRPMSVSITCSPRTNFGLNRNPSCSEVFRLAVAHSSHLEDLRLNVSRAYLFHFMNRADLAMLRSIVISLQSDQHLDEPVPEPAMPASVYAPRLRHMKLKGNGASTHLVPRCLFPHITHLSLDCNHTLDLAALFRDAVDLRRLTLMLAFSRDALGFRLPPGDRRICGPSSLSHLEVRLDGDMVAFGDPAILETLFDRLELPALETLSVSAPCEGSRHSEWDRVKESESVYGLLSRSRYARPRVVSSCQQRTRDEDLRIGV